MPIIVNLDLMLAKRKMKSNELAEIVGITTANLSILKTGKAKAIRFSTLEAICVALDCQPADILEANRLILEDIERDIKEAKVDDLSIISGRVKIGKGSEIINSKILGPVIIGKGAKLVNSYIGPFTSLSDRVEVIKSEIAYSVVLEDTKIINLKGRMERCLIGKGVKIYRNDDLPVAYEFVLGDHSEIGLV